MASTNQQITKPQLGTETEGVIRGNEDGANNRPAPLPPSTLVDLWNAETALPLPRCHGLTATRAAHVRRRLAERSVEDWREVFRRVNASAFLRGENDRSWKADFGWIVQSPDNALKVLEGKYDGVPASPRGGRTAGNQAAIQAFVDRRQS